MLSRSTSLLLSAGANTTWPQAIKQGLVFYWNGTKQLGRNISYAKRLVKYRFAGHKLSWSDQKHLDVISNDMLRLIPFSFFVIVPFMEFLLPFALYYFPSMLPSTYESDKQRVKRLETCRASQVANAEKLGNVEPNLKYILDSVQPPKVSFEEPLMDKLTQKHAYLLTKSIQKTAPLGAYTPLPVLKTSIRRYIRKIHAEDCALIGYGLVNVPTAQVHDACSARCIISCRNELQSWIEKSAKDATTATATKLLFHAVTSTCKA